MTHPKIISLDIETYGAVAGMPEQRYFDPWRSVAFDGVPADRLTHSIAITVPTADPREREAPPSTANSWDRAVAPVPVPWSTTEIARLEPGSTFVLNPAKPDELRCLELWLDHADTILGMNLPYDLSYLRFSYPSIRTRLGGGARPTHQLLDLSVLNYLHSEHRLERSLKTIGLITRTHRYEQTAKNTRFTSWDTLADYNAEDTHNTMLAAAVMAQRIEGDYAGTAKGRPFCLEYYSDAIWEAVRKTENGIPLDLDRLQAHAAEHVDRCRTIEENLTKQGLQLSGPGSSTETNPASRVAFLNRILTALTDLDVDVMAHPLLQRSDKTQKISFSAQNRNLFRLLLPPDHPYQDLLAQIQDHTALRKTYSTYLFPLLHSSRARASKRDAAALPIDPAYALAPRPTTTGGGLHADETAANLAPRPRLPFVSPVGLVHPSWFIVPSSYTDSSPTSGGTKQIRPTCKNPAAQTFPPLVKKCIRSRFGPHGRIVSYDLSQIELRVAAVLSGDPSLLNAYANGEDLHTQLTQHAEGADIIHHPDFRSGDSRTDPRQWYKPVNFLILYRGGPDKLQATLLDDTGVLRPLAWCQEAVRKIKSLRSGLVAWQDDLIERAETEGRIVLPIIGVSRLFEGGTKYQVNEIVNFPVQAYAGLVQNLLEIEISRQLPSMTSLSRGSILPIVNIYDCVKFDCADADAEKRCDEIMARAVGNLCRHGIWSQLQEHYGNAVPLVYEKD